MRRSTGYQPYQPAVGPIGSRKVLVVPAEEVKPQAVMPITQDMKVMSYILDERFKETRRIQGVFTDFGDFFGRDNRQTEATYLQGYGVLFVMEVSFSFSAATKPQAQQAQEPNEQADSTWQRAKQQVFSPGEAQGAEGAGSAEEYNSQMVEEFKRDLIATLKHAANIRIMQPDEWVILTVIGGAGPIVGAFGGGPMGGMGGGFGGGGFGGVSSSVSGGVSGGVGGGMGMGGGMMGGMAVYGKMGAVLLPTTGLTIRAKKSDVDAFAKGEQTFEQFQQKVTVLLY